MSTLLRLTQIILRTTDYHLVTMVYERTNTIFQRKHFGAAVHQAHTVDRETALQRSHLEKFVQQHVSVRIALHLYDDAHSFAVAFIVHVADALYAFFVHQASNILDQLSFVYAVRDFVYNNRIMLRPVFYFRLSA